MERHTVKLNLARNCLRYVIKAYGIEELHMPYYICPTLYKAVRKENCRIKFYHIDKNFYPAKDFSPNAYILYPNYFGICADNVFKLAAKYKNLIVDNAHNFYMPDIGLASFCSLRKFFNVTDGAFLYTSKILAEKFPKDEFRSEKINGKLSYEEFVNNEQRLERDEHEEIKTISDFTRETFAQIDIEKAGKQRLEKFRQYHKKYHKTNELLIKLTKYDVPFVYPYLIKDETTGKTFEQNRTPVI